MALPHLVKYIYNHGTDEVIRRGKKIHITGNIELVEYDELLSSVIFRVKDDVYATYYKVNISKFKDPKTISLRCGCPYNLGEICRHEAAALFQLQDLVDKNLLVEKEMVYDQRHTVVKMKQLDLKLIRLLTSSDAFTKSENYLRSNKANIFDTRDERVQAELEDEGITYKVVIQKNEERNFDTSCTCQSDDRHPLCMHKAVVLLQLLNSYGPNYFDSIRNWNKEKDKLLSLYGYSLDDDIEGKFEFTYKDGKPFLRVLDTSIKRIIPSLTPLKPFQIPAETIVIPDEEMITKQHVKLGIVFSYNPHHYPYLQADAVQGEINEAGDAFIGKVEKLDLTKFVSTEILDENDKMLMQQLRKLLPAEVSRYLSRNSPFSGIWENIIQQYDDELPEETRDLITEYLHPKYKKLFGEIAESNFVFFLPPHKTFHTSNLQHAKCALKFLSPEFAVNFVNEVYEVNCIIKMEDGSFSISENEISSPLVYKFHDYFYLWQKPEDVVLTEKFLPAGKIIISKEEWSSQLQRFILPLSKEYNIQFANVQREEIKNIKPEIKILLRERGDYLLFQPVFTYKGYDVRHGDKEKIILPMVDKLLVIHRNATAEKEFVHKIESLHSQFIHPEEGNILALKGTDVLKNNWFFLFADAVKEMNIPVYGFETLKNFRFNTARPSTKIYISGHTDWFDAKIDIHFGDQKVSVADVKKALTGKQQYVELQDGSLGILPEEWLKKYSLLFRIGEGKASHIKLSKYHYSVIEDLYNQRDEEELFVQLEAKYEKLRDNHSIKAVEAPYHLEHILRPYQKSGFQWLNYLGEVHWGGILADDMGLGKTIQALSFLHHLKKTK